MNAYYIKCLLPAPSRLLLSSFLTHCTHPSLCCYHAKQEKVLLPAAITHSPHHSVISYFSSPPSQSHIFADPTSTYSPCTPANGFHRMCSNLVLPTTFHPGNRLPGFSIQINRDGHTVCQNYFLCLPRPSHLISYHVFIELKHSSY